MGTVSTMLVMKPIFKYDLIKKIFFFLFSAFILTVWKIKPVFIVYEIYFFMHLKKNDYI